MTGRCNNSLIVVLYREQRHSQERICKEGQDVPTKLTPPVYHKLTPIFSPLPLVALVAVAHSSAYNGAVLPLPKATGCQKFEPFVTLVFLFIEVTTFAQTSHENMTY